MGDSTIEVALTLGGRPLVKTGRYKMKIRFWLIGVLLLGLSVSAQARLGDDAFMLCQRYGRPTKTKIAQVTTNSVEMLRSATYENGKIIISVVFFHGKSVLEKYSSQRPGLSEYDVLKFLELNSVAPGPNQTVGKTWMPDDEEGQWSRVDGARAYTGRKGTQVLSLTVISLDSDE